MHPSFPRSHFPARLRLLKIWVATMLNPLDTLQRCLSGLGGIATTSPATFPSPLYNFTASAMQPGFLPPAGTEGRVLSLAEKGTGVLRCPSVHIGKLLFTEHWPVAGVGGEHPRSDAHMPHASK